MSAWLVVLLDVIAGLLLGAFFYGGLWWTIRRISASAAGLWLTASFLLRAAVALAGFYVVARGTWYGAAGCLVGFLMARIAVTRLSRLRSEVSASSASGSGARTAP